MKPLDYLLFALCLAGLLVLAFHLGKFYGRVEAYSAMVRRF